MKELITKNSIFVKNENGEMIVAPSAIERIRDIEIQKKKLTKDYDKYRKFLKEGMEEYGIKKVDTDDILITYTEPYEKTVLDTNKLWKEYKDIAFKCQKDSEVKASVRITVR